MHWHPNSLTAENTHSVLWWQGHGSQVWKEGRVRSMSGKDEVVRALCFSEWQWGDKGEPHERELSWTVLYLIVCVYVGVSQGKTIGQKALKSMARKKRNNKVLFPACLQLPHSHVNTGECHTGSETREFEEDMLPLNLHWDHPNPCWHPPDPTPGTPWAARDTGAAHCQTARGNGLMGPVTLTNITGGSGTSGGGPVVGIFGSRQPHPQPPHPFTYSLSMFLRNEVPYPWNPFPIPVLLLSFPASPI